MISHQRLHDDDPSTSASPVILDYCLLVVSSELINECKKNGTALFPKDTILSLFFFEWSSIFKFKQNFITKILTFVISK